MALLENRDLSEIEQRAVKDFAILNIVGKVHYFEKFKKLPDELSLDDLLQVVDKQNSFEIEGIKKFAGELIKNREIIFYIYGVQCVIKIKEEKYLIYFRLLINTNNFMRKYLLKVVNYFRIVTQKNVTEIDENIFQCTCV